MTLQSGWNLISVPLEPDVTDALSQLGDDLPLFDVYQFYDGRFYENEKADIQAGIGYWVHVDNNAQLDLSGMPATPQVRVPLKPGWNVIGNPYEKPLPCDDSIVVECNQQSMILSQALAAKVNGSHRYQFDGQAYSQVAEGLPLDPWKGYFIKATQDCELIVNSS